MIKYIENRIWTLNAEIINTEADVESINQLLEREIISGIFAEKGLSFSYTQNNLGNYSTRPVEIMLKMNEQSLNLYQIMLDEKEILFKITSFQMIINTFGFLNILPVFEYSGIITPDNLTSIEINGDASAELIDLIFDDISQAIDLLHEIGIIRKSKFYHFGIPAEIEKYNLHTRDDSYNYLAHMFFFDEPEVLKDIISCYQAEQKSMSFEDVEFFYVFPLYFWKMGHYADDYKLIEKISMDAYLTCELVSCINSRHVYNSFLHILNQNHDIDSNKLRQIFNYNAWLIQSLRLFNPSFTLHQFRFMNMYRENSDLTLKNDLLKDAEQSLCFAIEGLEVSNSQQSGRVIQFILAMFTSLTLYSVINDVYTFITSDGPKNVFSIYSLQSVIFFVETLVVLSLILFFRKMSKKL